MSVKSFRVAAVAVSFLFISAVFFGCGSEENAEPETAELNETKTVADIEKGETFQIRLESNITTGYSWGMQELSDPEIIEFVGSAYIEPETDLIGAAGEELWEFKALDKGKTTINMFYSRSWEEEEAPAKEIVFEITVE